MSMVFASQGKEKCYRYVKLFEMWGNVKLPDVNISLYP